MKKKVWIALDEVKESLLEKDFNVEAEKLDKIIRKDYSKYCRKGYAWPEEETCSIEESELKRIRKKSLNELKGFQVWLVDGTYIRDNLDDDFVAGGNGGRYHYIPGDEIWIDQSTAPYDLAPYIFHEILEADLMRNKKWSYDKAHSLAAKKEAIFRQSHSPQELEEPLKQVEKWLEQI